MELKAYIAPLRRWWWLPILATVIATTSAFLATRRLPSIYQARTTLIIGHAFFSDPNPTNNGFGLSQQLAGAYADLLQQESVRIAVMTTLGLTALPSYVARPSTQFLEIDVTDTNPERAQAVANELASQLIRLRNGPQQGDQARQAFVNQQLDGLQADITSTQGDINKLQAELGKMFSASEIADTQKQIDALQTKLTTLQSNYTTLFITTQQGAVNTLSVLSSAARPTLPIGPNRLALVLLAGVSGCILAAGAAYLLEFLDATIRTPEEITHLFQLSVIGYIAEMGKGVEGKPHVAEQPHSMVAEAFRSLKANLEFAGSDRPLKTILVTSAAASEGKTTVAANLAIVMAQEGRKVILLDADLRRPKVHTFLGITNGQGLNEIYHEEIEVAEALQAWKDENLSVITAGSMAPNPTELLGSQKMSQILAVVQRMADVVILDGPPFLVTDAWVLSPKVDGVLLVIRPGYTHRDAVKTVMEQINRSGARVIGVTLNRIPAKQAEYYGGYWHISPYHAGNHYDYVGDNGSKKAKAVRSAGKTFGRLFRGSRRELDKVSIPSPSSRAAPLPTIPALEALPAAPSDAAPNLRDRAALELLYAISRELAGQLDLRDLLQRVLRLTLETVGASSGSIMVLDDKGEVIEGVVAYAGKVRLQDAQNLTDTVERGLAGWVINHRQAALIQSTREDPRWLSRSWDESDNTSRSAISVPLLVRDRVMGVLTLVHPQAGQFTEDDLSLLTAIGAYISFNGVNLLESAPN
jgi:capsular exopolysaccharide synthesis family protein